MDFLYQMIIFPSQESKTSEWKQIKIFLVPQNVLLCQVTEKI